jgi:deoxyribonuclease V
VSPRGHGLAAEVGAALVVHHRSPPRRCRRLWVARRRGRLRRRDGFALEGEQLAGSALPRLLVRLGLGQGRGSASDGWPRSLPRTWADSGGLPPHTPAYVALHPGRPRAYPAGTRRTATTPLEALGGAPSVGACYVCFTRGEAGCGRAGERGWAAAVLRRGNRGLVERAGAVGAAGAPYEPGLLALRERPLLEAALGTLSERPEVLLVNATGRDHPRAAGLALHLGAMLDLPSIGLTDRTLRAEGREPGAERGATSPASLWGVEVARLFRTRAGARPVVIHSRWRTDLDTATAVVRASTRHARTPEPPRRARRRARQARAAAGGRPARLACCRSARRGPVSASVHACRGAAPAQRFAPPRARVWKPSPPPASVGSLPGPTFEGGPGVLSRRRLPRCRRAHGPGFPPCFAGLARRIPLGGRSLLAFHANVPRAGGSNWRRRPERPSGLWV